MCVSPSYVWVSRGPGYQKQPKPCGVCWRCIENRISDYVGRSLCEAAYSEAVCALTITYAPRSDGAEKNLTPSHAQAFIRALRKRGHKIRYLIAGEYGELRGRAHFHVLLFWKSPAPDWPQEQKFHIEEWPHGHLFCDWTASDKAIRYVCKYLLKQERGDGWFSISKKPVLGWDFFREKAEENIKLGVFPSSFEYVPPNASNNKRYLMTGTTKMEYLTYISEGLAGTGRIIPSKMSEWAKKSMDKTFRRNHAREIERLPAYQKLIAQAEGFAEELDRRRISPYALSRLLFETSPEGGEWLHAQHKTRELDWLCAAIVEVGNGLEPKPPYHHSLWLLLAEVLPQRVKIAPWKTGENYRPIFQDCAPRARP